MICAIDNTVHTTREELHLHLRKLKVKQEEYYTSFEPRRDVHSGEIIPFKAPVERYLKQEFVDKNSLRKFIKTNSLAAQEWAINWLKKRKEEKQLVYPPTQVELRSLMAPSALYYDFIGGYNEICAKLGYTIRHNGILSDVELPSGAVIIEDTRENTPLEIDTPTIQQKVHCGDYALAVPYDQGIYIERKALGDFVGTLSERKIERKSGGDSNLDRFTRELERAKETGAYIIMLVEAGINDALGFNYLPQFTRRFGKRFDTKTRKMVDCEYRGAMPEHVFKNLRDLIVRFDNFQVLFVKDRDEAAKAVVKLLGAGDSVKKVDLELMYERKELVF